jgi:hypothetical protein
MSGSDSHNRFYNFFDAKKSTLNLNARIETATGVFNNPEEVL